MSSISLKNSSIPAFIALLAGCGSSAVAPGEPAPVKLASDVVFEAWDVKLAGRGEAGLDVRRPAVIAAVADSKSDVLCLNEVWRKADRDAIGAAGKTRFPHQATFDAALDTTPSDAHDQDGKVPTPPTSAPCDSVPSKLAVDRALSCAMKNCSTVPGSDEGYLTDYKCAQASCISELVAIQAASTRCYNCVGVGTNDGKYADVKKECESNPKGGYAFGGDNGVLLLSRLPISKVETRVMPSTNFRRTVVHASLKADDGSDVDVYCTNFSEIFLGLVAPYSGLYGRGHTDDKGWAAEQQLQEKQLVDYVKASAASGRAVVLGNFNASTEWSDGKDIVVSANAGEPTINALDAALTPGVVAGYKPSCTLCSDNAWMTPKVSAQGSDPVWTSRIYLQGIDKRAVHESKLTHTDAVIEWSGMHMPASPHYGFSSAISLAK